MSRAAASIQQAMHRKGHKENTAEERNRGGGWGRGRFE